MSSLHKYHDEIRQAMTADQFGLERLLRSIERSRRQGRPFDRNLRKLRERLEESCQLRKRRIQSVPRITWPEDLPVVAHRSEIADAIRDNQVVVVCGETGSGKSTQLPKIALELGRGIAGTIGHTQPRRIAARSIAVRLSEELGCRPGQQAGYRIRFNDASGPETLIRLMTDGIMLAETQSDRFLSQYDTIIVDEAHERSLNIDFLLGYLRRLLPKRPDLRVIITSATIDAERFAEFFSTNQHEVPVLLVEGRTWPVEVRYQPLSSDDENGPSAERDWLDGVTSAVDGLAGETRGHVLVFLPTERDIREAARHLSGRSWPGDTTGQSTQIVPLYGRLSMADQARVFRPYQHRRIVLATNVAESSVTVPGIHAVVDTGTARISRYSARSRIQRLPIEPVSRASARQRSGRCGRIGPGVCIRLYSEEDFDQRDEFTQPEIQRTNLAAVILRTLYLKLGNLEDFPFLDPPRPATIRDGYRTLEELGAVRTGDQEAELTKIGTRMAVLPVDPRISRMILAGVDEQAAPEILIIASALEIQDPRERPLDQQQAADEAHAVFNHSDSDFLSWLNLWDAWHENKAKLSGNQLKKWCRRNFLSWMRMREWIDVHRQLRDLLADSGDRQLRRAARLHPKKDRRNDFAAIHRSLITGFLNNLAWKTGEREFTGPGGRKLTVWPGSSLAKKPPKWLVAGELIETSRRYARSIARIQPEWVEPLAGHLLKREILDPHWDGKSGNVMAFEKLSLWGLPIVPRRRVSLAKHDSAKSRELLIQHGLVELGLLYGETVEQRESQFAEEEQQLDAGIRSRLTPGREQGPASPDRTRPPWAAHFRFLQNNADVLKELQTLQTKMRQHDLVPGDEFLFRFYADRIPAHVSNRERLKDWYQSAGSDNSELLMLSLDQFVSRQQHNLSREEFPAELIAGSLRLPLSYQMKPGQAADGVTVTVPVDALPQLTEDQLSWLVPGMVESKVTALIRGLPKRVRHLFVPVPDTARQICDLLEFGSGALEEQTAGHLSRIGAEVIPADLLKSIELPEHLQMLIHVVDRAGKRILEQCSLAGIRDQLNTLPSAASVDIKLSAVEKQWHRRGFRAWEFSDIPVSISVRRAGIDMPAWPAIRDDTDSVSLTLCQSLAQAQAVLKRGLRRLCRIQDAGLIRKRVRNLGDLHRVELLASSIRGIQLHDHLQLLMVERAYLSGKKLPRTKSEFDSCLLNGRDALSTVSAEFVRFLPSLFEDYHSTRRLLEESSASGRESLHQDMKEQLESLVNADFLATTSWAWLMQFPRYFSCIRHRLQRLASGGLATEQQLFSELTPFTDRLMRRIRQQEDNSADNPMLEHYRWMLEEFRVQQYSPKLGTAIDVSAKKLDEHWQKVP
ncbi:MAG: ATP-dependent RNA helicase HrpA [Fuerstiella sp.]|nr:ATP-dependent RNA helicase HrpA [Fuerstiella sp.]